MKTIAMIPARAGSKGLVDKNIIELSGLPLIAHSILPAVNSNLVEKVYVNSDSEVYISVGEKYGATGYLRPNHLANDTATMRSVVEDFLNYVVSEYSDVDSIIVLYPTYPFRTADDINDMLCKFSNSGVRNSLIGIKEPATHPCLVYVYNENNEMVPFSNKKCGGLYRRQDYPVAYELTHWACIISVEDFSKLNDQLINENSIGYFIEDVKKTVDIDGASDYEYAQYLSGIK